jgi:Flp pilus assembly pilin Flp
MTTIFERLGRDDAGQAMVEYAFILALVAFVTVGALTAIGVNVNAILQQVAAGL